MKRELFGTAARRVHQGIRRRRAISLSDSQDNLLVTGAAGLIGRVLAHALSESYAMHGLDVEPGPDIEWVGDMARGDSVRGAFEGIDTVVHLAADARVSAPWESVVRNNVVATVNALEASREAGVRRLVFASSNHVVGMYEHDEPYASIVAGRYDGLDPDGLARIGVDAPIRPDGPYGVSKAFGEAAARSYSELHGLSVLCLRIGSVTPADRPTDDRHFATLLTHRDLVHLVRCCLTAPDSIRFGVFYGVSANTWRFWDIDAAREAIGYEPQDDAERWR